MSHLLLVSIGPVQSFIASARRTRDLWYSSWLLSELAKSGARMVAARCGADALVFPAIGDDADASAPNRIVALVEEDAQDLADAVEASIRGRLDELAQQALDRIPKGAQFDRSMAELQIRNSLLEVYWVACRMQRASEYPQARRRLEALIAARKNTRAFEAVSWGAPTPKSSLDGLRESVIPESNYSAPRADAVQRARAARRLYDSFRAGPAERLSGVDLLKRLGAGELAATFPSTSAIAAGPYLRLLTSQGERVRAAWNAYTVRLRELEPIADLDTTKLSHPVLGNYDPALLYESRLGEFFDAAQLPAARQALQAFLSAAGTARPPRYYALLAGDGDDMGRFLDGMAGVEAHRTVSDRLSALARDTRAVVESRHHGALVYSGGDDVLALLPVDTALEAARALAVAFSQAVEAMPPSSAGRASLSVGMAIVHHLTPLAGALQLVREAEGRAKRVEGKNALAVTVDKRSGAPRTVAGRWGTLDVRLGRYVGWHLADEIPGRAAYDLRDLDRRLAPQPGTESEDVRVRTAAGLEALRLALRKRAQHGRTAVGRPVIESLSEDIQAEMPGIGQIADELIIASTFADAARCAPIAASAGGAR